MVMLQYAPAVAGRDGDVTDFGGRPDRLDLTTLSTTASSAVVTSSTSVFTPDMVTKACVIAAAGAANRTVASAGSMAAGSNRLTCTGAAFVAADLGKFIVVRGAGFGGADLYTQIMGLSNGTDWTTGTTSDGVHALLLDAAITTVSGAAVIIRATLLKTTVLSYQSATQITLAATAGVTLSNAVGLIATDSLTAANLASAAANAAGGGERRWSAGKWYLSAQPTSYAGVADTGAGSNLTSIMLPDDVLGPGFGLAGTAPTRAALAADAAADQRTVVLTTGGGAHFKQGDPFVLQDANSGIAGATYTAGSGPMTHVNNNGVFHTHVSAVSGDTLTTEDALPISFRYTEDGTNGDGTLRTDGGQNRPAGAYYYGAGGMMAGISISGMTIDVLVPAPTLSSVNRSNAFYTSHAVRPRIRDVRGIHYGDHTFKLEYCLHPDLDFDAAYCGQFSGALYLNLCTSAMFRAREIKGCPFGVSAIGSPYTIGLGLNMHTRSRWAGPGSAYNSSGTATTASTPGRGLKFESNSAHSKAFAVNLRDTGLYGIYFADSPYCEAFFTLHATGADTTEHGAVISGFLIATANFQHHNCRMVGEVIGAGGIGVWLDGAGNDTYNTVDITVKNPGNYALYVQSNRNTLRGNYNGGSVGTVVQCSGNNNNFNGQVNAASGNGIVDSGTGNNWLGAKISSGLTNTITYALPAGITVSDNLAFSADTDTTNRATQMRFTHRSAGAAPGYLMGDYSGSWAMGLSMNGYYAGANAWNYQGVSGTSFKGGGFAGFTHAASFIVQTVADSSAGSASFGGAGGPLTRLTIDSGGLMAHAATGVGTTPAEIKSATDTIAGAVTDGYSAGMRLSPTYSAATALTVTRHNYLDVNQPTLTGVGPAALTDAAVLRFNAAAGTHKAVDAATTKTTPGGVDAWIKVNLNGTLAYVPAYLSKTA